MNIFKVKWFANRFARKERITDAMLRQAVSSALKKPDADLGGGVIKQRVARPGGGKSGGYRTIILFRKGTRAVFVYGFAKNKRDNVNDAELAAFKELAENYLNATAGQIEDAVEAGELFEVSDGDENENDEKSKA